MQGQLIGRVFTGRGRGVNFAGPGADFCYKHADGNQEGDGMGDGQRTGAAAEGAGLSTVPTTVVLQFSLSDLALIDKAAARAGMTRSELIGESALMHAAGLLENRTFTFDTDARFEALATALDSPIPTLDEVRTLLAGKPPWE
jgi:uncharacterized protein (DUF1778 family)